MLKIERPFTPPTDRRQPRRVAPRLGGGLGTAYEICVQKRTKRFALQKVAARLMTGERVAECMLHLKDYESGVEVWYRPPRAKGEHGRAFYKGLKVCGSVWMCPVCAAKITERRRVELAEGLAKWGGSVFMVTFTFQHTVEDRLKDLVNYLNDAVRRLKSGRWWQEFESRYGLVGSVAGLETTVSQGAGWHPHKHMLFFSNLRAGRLDRLAIQTELLERFAAIMQKLGRYASSVYGVQVSEIAKAKTGGKDALKQYVAKWGLDAELAKSPVKVAKAEGGVIHYSPFELLELAGAGLKWGEIRFREYATVMKGHKQLVWSRGLRAVLGLDQVEKTDEQLVEEQVETGDSLLVALSARQWKQVVAADARAEVLTVGDSGDKNKVILFLNRLGVIIEEVDSS